MFSAGDVVIFGRSWQIWILQVNQIPHGLRWSESGGGAFDSFSGREERRIDTSGRYWTVTCSQISISSDLFSEIFCSLIRQTANKPPVLKSMWGSGKKIKTNDSRSRRRLFLVLVEVAGRLWSVEDRNSYVGCAHFQFQVLMGLKRAVCLQPVWLFELVCLMLRPHWTYWFHWVAFSGSPVINFVITWWKRTTSTLKIWPKCFHWAGKKPSPSSSAPWNNQQMIFD